MASLEAIHDGVLDALSSIPDLATFDSFEGAPSPPWALIIPPTVAYRRSFGSGGSNEAEMDLYVLTGSGPLFTAAGVRAAWKFLDGDGPHSIRAALFADPTFGGRVEGLRVPSARFTSGEEAAGLEAHGLVLSISFLWSDDR